MENKIFEYFKELSKIPRGSRNTGAVSAYCAAFAKKRGLDVFRDKLGNVIIKKPASEGYENSPAVILQGHLDMVCIAEDGLDFDFENEGIQLFRDGDLLGARGTTLGADDGIAVAMIFDILDRDDIPHPPIEAVFTVDEEVGLTGAEGFDASRLDGKRMINIDSEEEGIITAGCAGGVRVTGEIPCEREAFDGWFCEISVSGLAGGHSGIEIGNGRANANRLLAAVISEIAAKTDVRLVSFDGGLRDNAIPSAAKAVAALKDVKAAEAVVKNAEERFKSEYSGESIRFKITEAAEETPLDKRSTGAVLRAVTQAPDGVQAMSRDIDGLVQTSLNLGTVKTNADSCKLSFMIRSSVDAEKRELLNRVSRVIEDCGGSVAASGDYAAWEYRGHSPLRDTAVEAYKKLYGNAPEVAIIHAGLECGIFAGKIADFDAISIGPDITGAHTPKERLSISSAKRIYNYILEILKGLK